MGKATLENYRLPNFNMIFQFLLTKFSKSELFSCYKLKANRNHKNRSGVKTNAMRPSCFGFFLDFIVHHP